MCVKESDVREVLLYRRGLVIVATSFMTAGSAVFMLEGNAVRQVADLRRRRREARPVGCRCSLSTPTSPRSSGSSRRIGRLATGRGPGAVRAGAPGLALVCRSHVCCTHSGRYMQMLRVFLISEYEWCECSNSAMLMVIQFAKTLHCIIVQFVNNVDSNTSIIKPLLFHFSLQFSGWTS